MFSVIHNCFTISHNCFTISHNCFTISHNCFTTSHNCFTISLFVSATGTNLPSVVYKDLHIDPPLPSYYDNFWYHELRSSPVDYSRLGDDDYTASSNDAINVMDRRSRRDLSPPRVTKLNVFLDGPSPSKKQYVWQQNATPPGHPNIPAQGAVSLLPPFCTVGILLLILGQ